MSGATAKKLAAVSSPGHIHLAVLLLRPYPIPGMRALLSRAAFSGSGGARHASSRALPTSATFLVRLRHQMADFWTVFTFNAPTLNLSTQLPVGTTTLWLRQWSGTDVGSGGAVWGASRRLIQYLETYGDGAPAVPSPAEGEAAAIAVPSRTVGTLRLIELGSGTGAAGLAAAVLGFAHVTLSDQASFCFPNAPGEREAPARSLLDLARTNLELNIGAINSAQSDSISSMERTHPTGANSANSESSLADHAPAADAHVAAVAQLLWGDEADHAALPHAKYDVVLGSDVLLFTSAMLPLLATLRRVSHEGTVGGSKECEARVRLLGLTIQRGSPGCAIRSLGRVRSAPLNSPGSMGGSGAAVRHDRRRADLAALRPALHTRHGRPVRAH